MRETPNAVRRLKQLVEFEADEQHPYRCEACGSTFDVQYHVCPECGGFSVDAN